MVQLGTTNTNVAPPPGVSSHQYAAAVRGHERVHDRQAEPGAGGVGARVEARELLEDALALLRRDAGPVIGDADLHSGWVRHRSGGHEDLGARRREPQRVLEQVAEDLLDHLDVDLHVAELQRDVEPDAVGARQWAEPADRGLGEVAQVDGLAVDVERAGADPAELEDVGDQPFEAVGLVVDRVEELGAVVGVELEIRRAQGRRSSLDRRQGCPQVVGDRGEEARPGAADLRREARLVRLRLQAQAVDRGGQPRDQRFEQGPVGCAQRALAARRRLHLQRRDAHHHDLSRDARRGRGGDETGGPQRAHHQPEQRDQGVGRAGHDRLEVLARHEPRREVEADLRLALALLGRAAGLVETRHRPAQHARRSRERDQGEQVVALLHVEAFARRGEEVVQGEERADDADDRADASEERRQQRGHQEHQRGRGEVDVEEPADCGRDPDDQQRGKRLLPDLDGILTRHRRALTSS